MYILNVVQMYTLQLILDLSMQKLIHKLLQETELWCLFPWDMWTLISRVGREKNWVKSEIEYNNCSYWYFPLTRQRGIGNEYEYEYENDYNMANGHHYEDYP